MMSISGFPEETRLGLVISSLTEMEALGERIRTLVARQSPHDLLGYIYSQRMLLAIHEQDDVESEEAESNVINEVQFVLEYVHAVLASTPENQCASFSEADCAELFECAKKLKAAALFHAMASSVGTEDGAFGLGTGDVEFRAKTNWVLLRGNRYQALEGEFYAFVLAPHDVQLRETYGIGADEIAAGFQDMADASRAGQADAFDEMAKQFDAATQFAEAEGKLLEEVADDWLKQHAEEMKTTALAVDDLIRGGICNVSRHTSLPVSLLADLAFDRNEESEFFASGPYSGTPFRTLPARKKPLIKLGDDYYAVDPCFTRDAGYRSLLWNLLRRRPDYKKEFEKRQKVLGEDAFFNIFSAQLKGAVVHQEIYYRDVVTRQWVENDTLVLIDDILILIEAKAGAAATIASPALDFARHIQAVQDLVVKAYLQCKRFFGYLASAEEVPIFKRANGKYVECGRLRRTDYRVMFPIGLTVESFSPFSAMCKELQDIAPLLGHYGFLSLSIDDLFVLTRFLPSMGELAHYLEVRQALACMKGAHLFDELDHLGAYIKKNRFDHDISEQLAKEDLTMVIWDGMSKTVDSYFEGEDWQARSIPTQAFPQEVISLLGALNRTRAAGWLSVESHIRDYGEEGRIDLAKMLEACRATLDKFPARYFLFIGTTSLFVSIQRAGTLRDWSTVKAKASAAAIAGGGGKMIAVAVSADASGNYTRAERFEIDMPITKTLLNKDIYDDAARMVNRQRRLADDD